MSSNKIDNIDVTIKVEDSPEENSPDSEELLVKKSSKGKFKGPADDDSKSLLKKEKSMSFKMKSDSENQVTYSVTSKDKSVQKLYNEPSTSGVNDLEDNQDNVSVANSNISESSNNNGKSLRQSASQLLRNKRFSYNTPSTSNTHHWNSSSISNANNVSSPTTSSNSTNNNTNTTSVGNNNSNNNNRNSSHGRPSFGNHPLSGSFAELLNLTSSAAQAIANSQNANNNNNTNNNNSNNNVPTSPSSRHNSISSNIQQNINRLGLSDNINIETVDPTSSDDEGGRPSQVGPGETAWLLFRIYAIFRFIWSLIFSSIYFVHFIIKKSKSCDEKIYTFSIVFAILFAIHALSTLVLIFYLPTSITRYNSVIRRRVVISTHAWKITAFTFLGEIVMVIVGAILLFNKDPSCSTEENMAYVNITKVIVLIVVCMYTMLLFPFFIIPCACTFKLLPEYKGISEKTLKRFNSILYNPTEEVDEADAPSCPICMESYKPGTKIKRLPCNHEFHPECITEWLEINNSCPICRQIFK